MKKVVALMSGGVDSSVSAYLLVRAGYEVIGVTMDLFQGSCQIDNPRSCCSLAAFEDARKVAENLGIPHYVLNLREEFEKEVISYFKEKYINGKTPNPCIICNERIKFGTLLNKAKELGADYVATGHYAKIEYNKEKRYYLLKKGKDLRKDQSYVLFTLRQEQLKSILLPLGEFTKTRVRKIARKLRLKVHDKPESQQICFVPDGNYRKFLSERGVPEKPGPIMDKEGRVLGEHRGIHLYTIGQRKGLGIALGRPLYVTGIDKKTNAVIVGGEKDLFQDELIAHCVNWIIRVDRLPLEVKAKIRYTHKGALAKLSHLSNGRVHLKFRPPQRAITPGQAVVFYKGKLVIGGGWIEEEK